MKRLSWFRFILAAICTVAIAAVGVLVVFYGATLSGVQVSLLTLAISLLGSGKGSAFSWFYDGAADKPPTTVSVPDPTKPASLTATPKVTP